MFERTIASVMTTRKGPAASECAGEEKVELIIRTGNGTEVLKHSCTLTEAGDIAKIVLSRKSFTVLIGKHDWALATVDVHSIKISAVKHRKESDVTFYTISGSEVLVTSVTMPEIEMLCKILRSPEGLSLSINS